MLQAGQENTPHNGQIVKGETFKLIRYNVGLAYDGKYPLQKSSNN